MSGGARVVLPCILGRLASRPGDAMGPRSPRHPREGSYMGEAIKLGIVCFILVLILYALTPIGG